jgi:hypothetical protein
MIFSAVFDTRLSGVFERNGATVWSVGEKRRMGVSWSVFSAISVFMRIFRHWRPYDWEWENFTSRWEWKVLHGWMEAHFVFESLRTVDEEVDAYMEYAQC